MNQGPFELFCMYYLGLAPDGEVQFTNANKVAARLNWTVGELMQTLQKHGLHPDKVLNTDFPMARYQVDFQIAAESESPERLVAYAERIFEEFRGAVHKTRDWLAEIEREKREDRDRGRY